MPPQPQGQITTRVVRDVSPNKMMVVINFTLPLQSSLLEDTPGGAKVGKRKLSVSEGSGVPMEIEGASSGEAVVAADCESQHSEEPCLKNARR